MQERGIRQGRKFTERCERIADKNVEKWKGLGGGGNVRGNTSRISERECQGLDRKCMRLPTYSVLASLRNIVWLAVLDEDIVRQHLYPSYVSLYLSVCLSICSFPISYFSSSLSLFFPASFVCSEDWGVAKDIVTIQVM